MFHSTRWSVVLRVGGDDGEEARMALAELCEAYWQPLYEYVRRRGEGPDDARDVVQGFFALLLERGDLEQVSPERGRFRSFLLASVRHFLADERDRKNAAKRGGDRATLSLDFEAGESRVSIDPADDVTPERAYERAWALSLLDRALVRLGAEYEVSGKQRLFEALRGQLTAGSGERRLREIGEELGLTESAVKVAAHRLRKRYRDALKHEVAQTVQGAEDVDAELRELLAALG